MATSPESALKLSVVDEAVSKDCAVCTDRYSKKLRRRIRCPHCGFECCLACIRRFLLSSVVEPACMSCRVQFGYEYIQEILPQSFWNGDYKEFRKTLLLGREEAYLPDTQPCVRRIQMMKGFRRFIENYHKKIVRLQKIHDRLTRHMNRLSTLIYEDKIGRREIQEDDPRFRLFDDDGVPRKNDQGDFLCLLPATGETETETDDGRSGSSRTSSAWVVSCPQADCRGFLRGEQTRCPLCSTRICKDCLKILPTEIDEIHTCDPEEQKTVELLRANTRSCPSCRTSIYKISGCDQMWCVQCHTAFSWNTGRIVNQTIHNPHYYEWIRRTAHNRTGGEPARNLLDVPCGGLPTAIQITRVFEKTHEAWAMHLHQAVTHLEGDVIPYYTDKCTQNEGRKELRVMYLSNQISKEDWKNELYRREKTVEKYRQYLQILQTFVTVVSEWFRKIVLMVREMPSKTHRETIDEVIEVHMIEICEFWGYINNQIRHLNRRFHSALPIIPLYLNAETA